MQLDIDDKEINLLFHISKTLGLFCLVDTYTPHTGYIYRDSWVLFELHALDSHYFP